MGKCVVSFGPQCVITVGPRPRTAKVYRMVANLVLMQHREWMAPCEKLSWREPSRNASMPVAERPGALGQPRVIGA